MACVQMDAHRSLDQTNAFFYHRAMIYSGDMKPQTLHS